MNQVTLATPCLRRYDLLQKLFESAERGTRRPDNYVVVDNGGQLYAKMASGEIKLPLNTMVINPGKQISVAGAWNLILRECEDWVIISNDDVEFYDTTVASLVSVAETEEAEFVYPSHDKGSMFCVFLIKHSILDTVGEFDEQFFPAYFEDNDFHRRMRIAGTKEAWALNAGYTHIKSATVKSFNRDELELHHQNFRLNEKRYADKWGGVPGKETLEKPASCESKPETIR
jgi:GT2 family glycosyltransferase